MRSSPLINVLVAACTLTVAVALAPAGSKLGSTTAMPTTYLDNLEHGGAAIATSSTKSSIGASISTPLSFLLFYMLNILYNISNKRTLQHLPFPISISIIQLLTGSFIYLLTILLSLNKRPTLPSSKSHLIQASGSHLIGQILTVLSLSAGAVSFTHIVKSTEPLFSCAASYCYTGVKEPTPVYLSLLPIIGGVAFACLNDVSFNVKALACAMGSNLFFGARAVSSKLVLQKSGKEMGGAGGVYGVVTCAASAVGIPVMLATDFQPFLKALSELSSPGPVLHLLFISGFYHYVNNEVMYRCLDAVTPITLAVGNALKRVFLIVSSVIVFQTQVSVQGWVGSAVACAGVCGYGVVKEKCKQMQK